MQARLFTASSDTFLLFMEEGGFLDPPRRDKSSRPVFYQGKENCSLLDRGARQRQLTSQLARPSADQWFEVGSITKTCLEEPSLHSVSQAESLKEGVE